MVEEKQSHEPSAGAGPAKRGTRVTLENPAEVWEQVFTVAPLILVGSLGESGKHAFTPKHRITPLGDGYFGFVCKPEEKTCHNVRRQGVFTISYPRPHPAVLSSLALPQRDDCEPLLDALPTFPAIHVEGAFLEDGYLFLECELDRVIDGFGDHVLVAGRVVAVHVDEEVLRRPGREDQDLLVRHPLLAYLHAGRFAPISMSYALLAARGLKSYC